MKLGIKVGPQKQSFRDIVDTNALFAEVWFNIACTDDYDELFSFMKQRNMDIGLHFWGTVDTDTEANISFPDASILRQSRQLIQQSINIAARYKCVYVNIHPGGRTLTKINFANEEFIATDQTKNQRDCEETLRESLVLLSTHAYNTGVQLTVESIPPYDPGAPWSDPKSRSKPVYNYQMPLAALERIIRQIQFLGFANDLAHTASQIISNNRDLVAEYLITQTRSMADLTKLVHIGYIIPPYIGTDYHGHWYDSICQSSKAVPNTTELQQLLQIFTNRDDVYALVEPPGDHVKNYAFVQNLLASR